jgi:hypothetical protein
MPPILVPDSCSEASTCNPTNSRAGQRSLLLGHRAAAQEKRKDKQGQ